MYFNTKQETERLRDWEQHAKDKCTHCWCGAKVGGYISL